MLPCKLHILVSSGNGGQQEGSSTIAGHWHGGRCIELEKSMIFLARFAREETGLEDLSVQPCSLDTLE